MKNSTFVAIIICINLNSVNIINASKSAAPKPSAPHQTTNTPTPTTMQTYAIKARNAIGQTTKISNLGIIDSIAGTKNMSLSTPSTAVQASLKPTAAQKFAVQARQTIAKVSPFQNQGIIDSIAGTQGMSLRSKTTNSSVPQQPKQTTSSSMFDLFSLSKKEPVPERVPLSAITRKKDGLQLTSNQSSAIPSEQSQAISQAIDTIYTTLKIDPKNITNTQLDAGKILTLGEITQQAKDMPLSQVNQFVTSKLQNDPAFNTMISKSQTTTPLTSTGKASVQAPPSALASTQKAPLLLSQQQKLHRGESLNLFEGLTIKKPQNPIQQPQAKPQALEIQNTHTQTSQPQFTKKPSSPASIAMPKDLDVAALQQQLKNLTEKTNMKYTPDGPFKDKLLQINNSSTNKLSSPISVTAITN